MNKLKADNFADQNYSNLQKMFSINSKFLEPGADIRLNKAAMGQQFAPEQPILYLNITIKENLCFEALRQSLWDGLEPFTILEFNFFPLETKDTGLVIELGTMLQPNTILSVIELIIEKNKNSKKNAEARTK